MDLSRLSDEELNSELERRKLTAPRPLPVPDFTDLVKTVTDGVARSMAEGFEDDDFSQYVYESAMKAVYGPGYFLWRNRQKW
jgi:hypothetical protein